MREEPEAVDRETQTYLTTCARLRDERRYEQEIESRRRDSFAGQVEAYEALARARHIDIRSELRAIRRWRDPAARVKQLERIRLKVDPPLAA